MANHTPTPWKAQRDLRHSTNHGTLHDGSPKAWGVYGGYRVCDILENLPIAWDEDTEAEANAKFIAHAVNNHDTMLEALTRLREWVREPGPDDSPENDQIMLDADAAIAAGNLIA